MKNRCVIIAGGDCDTEKFTEILETDYLIAADSGLKYTESAGIVPDLIVGDFDSYKGAIPTDVEVLKLPTRKNDTDLLYALRCGVERGYNDFLIFGGYGSRPDQNLAMLQSLVWLCENCDTACVRAVCCGFEVYAIKNKSINLQLDRNKYLSVFSISNDAKCVDIVGADYPLSNATVTPSFPIGVSNESEGKVTVSVKDGTLIIMTVVKNI